MPESLSELIMLFKWGKSYWIICFFSTITKFFSNNLTVASIESYGFIYVTGNRIK